jgi:FkbM family methyltransferase
MAGDIARRLAWDVASVCQNACPGSAARWMGGLVANLPACVRSRSLSPADRHWDRAGARFRTSTRVLVSLPPSYTPCAREMYCRNVYLRTGLQMPTSGWVIDLGANQGLFSVWAAVNGADVVAVEAQQGYADRISHLAEHNAVAQRVHVEIAMASGVTVSGAKTGVLADDRLWAMTSHGAPTRPADISLPRLMSAYGIKRVGLLKVDIEGGEFAVFADSDLRWLDSVDQLALEVHPPFGDAIPLIGRLRACGFTVDLRDNNGGQVAPTCDRLEYAYCRRH